MTSKTFRMFTVLPGLMLGIATALDMGSIINIYHYDTTPAVADINATASDWYMVGEDMKSAISGYNIAYEE